MNINQKINVNIVELDFLKQKMIHVFFAKLKIMEVHLAIFANIKRMKMEMKLMK
jgi:hypothetical protein